jgi:hypothetical protein
MTTRVTYVGQHDEVETVLDGKPVILSQGESIDVSEEQAHLLLDQPLNWEGDRPTSARAGASSCPPPPADAIPAESEVTVDELKEQLRARGITFTSRARKDELLALLESGGAPPTNDDQAGDGDTN